MKKGYWKGFLTGTLMGVLILGLGITAMGPPMRRSAPSVRPPA